MNFCSGLILLIILDKTAHQKSGTREPEPYGGILSWDSSGGL